MDFTEENRNADYRDWADDRGCGFEVPFFKVGYSRSFLFDF
jgi:hypothetical protein